MNEFRFHKSEVLRRGRLFGTQGGHWHFAQPRQSRNIYFELSQLRGRIYGPAGFSRAARAYCLAFCHLGAMGQRLATTP